MTLSQVTATAQQWGDLVRVTDVANLTIKHPLFQQAIQLVSLQMPETLERNTMNTLVAGNQINFANGRASRALVATDVFSPTEVYRAVGSMETYGVPHFMGDEREDMMIEAARVATARSPRRSCSTTSRSSPAARVNDMRQNATVANAWAQSRT
jgi:N4-gp56 family major capsid protein